jgi:hypothetical protein
MEVKSELKGKIIKILNITVHIHTHTHPLPSHPTQVETQTPGNNSHSQQQTVKQPLLKEAEHSRKTFCVLVFRGTG